MPRGLSFFYNHIKNLTFKFDCNDARTVNPNTHQLFLSLALISSAHVFELLFAAGEMSLVGTVQYRFTIPYYAEAVRAARTEVKLALENCLRRLVMGQVVKPPASRVSRGRERAAALGRCAHPRCGL